MLNAKRTSLDLASDGAVLEVRAIQDWVLRARVSAVLLEGDKGEDCPIDRRRPRRYLDQDRNKHPGVGSSHGYCTEYDTSSQETVVTVLVERLGG